MFTIEGNELNAKTRDQIRNNIVEKDNVNIVTNQYCIYCGQKRLEFSKEHFIPQVIGGKDYPTIEVCISCNGKLGSLVDSKLGRLPLLVYTKRGISQNKSNNKYNRIPATAILNNGYQIKGYVEFKFKTGPEPHPIVIGNNVIFHPDNSRLQYGIKWLIHSPINCRLPHGVKRLFNEDIKSIKHPVLDKSALQQSFPAMLKILLGAMYWDLTSNNLADQNFFNSMVFRELRDIVWNRKPIPETFRHYIGSYQKSNIIDLSAFPHCFVYQFAHGAFVGEINFFNKIMFRIHLECTDYSGELTRCFTLDGKNSKIYSDEQYLAFLQEQDELLRIHNQTSADNHI